MAPTPAGSPGSAAVATGSFPRLALEHRRERIGLMALGEGEEALLRRGAVGHVGFEDALDLLRGVLRLHIAIDVAAERRIGAEAAADQDVIALDRIAVLGLLHLARQQ